MIEQLKKQANIEHAHFGSGAGDGIVYVGGGKYWEGIVTGILMLRDCGCLLPVEVWYRGDCETVNPDDVEGLNVRLINLDAMGRLLGDNAIPTGSVTTGGWEAKLYALHHTDFDRVLFLDADAYVVDNPVPLFELLDDYDFVTWKDVEGQRGSIKWQHVLPEGKQFNLCPVQGGQFLLDKIKAKQLISVANWICQHSAHYFRFMFGDQDTWRVANALLRLDGQVTQQLMIGKAEWREGVAFVCSWKGKPYIVHRCSGKMFKPEYIPTGKHKYSNPQYRLPSECRAFDLFAQVINRQRKDSVKTFSSVYRSQIWGSGSGAGSRLEEAQLYIDTINRLARLHRWEKAVDIGSGDGFVSSHLRFKEYVGYDCVEEVVRKARLEYKKNYKCVDILTQFDIIDSGDVLLCKDVLHHWPTSNIVEFLTYLISSKKWRHIVLCQDSNQIHPLQDCYLGGYRALSPNMEPLSKFPITQTIRVHHKTLCLIG